MKRKEQILFLLLICSAFFTTQAWAMSGSSRDTSIESISAFEQSWAEQDVSSFHQSAKDLGAILPFALEQKIDINSLLLLNQQSNEIWQQLLHCAAGDVGKARKIYAEGARTCINETTNKSVSLEIMEFYANLRAFLLSSELWFYNSKNIELMQAALQLNPFFGEALIGVMANSIHYSQQCSRGSIVYPAGGVSYINGCEGNAKIWLDEEDFALDDLVSLGMQMRLRLHYGAEGEVNDSNLKVYEEVQKLGYGSANYNPGKGEYTEITIKAGIVDISVNFMTGEILYKGESMASSENLIRYLTNILALEQFFQKEAAKGLWPDAGEHFLMLTSYQFGNMVYMPHAEFRKILSNKIDEDKLSYKSMESISQMLKGYRAIHQAYYSEQNNSMVCSEMKTDLSKKYICR